MSVKTAYAERCIFYVHIYLGSGTLTLYYIWHIIIILAIFTNVFANYMFRAPSFEVLQSYLHFYMCQYLQY